MDESTIEGEGTPDRADAGQVVVAERVTRTGVALGGSIEPGHPRRRIPVVRIATVVTIGALIVLALARPAPAPLPPARSTADPFASVDFLAWSPDGTQLAYLVRTRAPIGADGPAAGSSAPAPASAPP